MNFERRVKENLKHGEVKNSLTISYLKNHEIQKKGIITYIPLKIMIFRNLATKFNKLHKTNYKPYSPRSRNPSTPATVAAPDVSSSSQSPAELLHQASSSLSELKKTHAHLLRRHIFHIDQCLLSLYASLSSPSSAFSVVSSSPNPSLHLYNRAIRVLSKSRLALRLYARMPALAISPDNFTFPFLLNSCAAAGDLLAGAEIHSRLIRTGFARHLPVANALIDMYGKCAQLHLAGRVFGEMVVTDLVSHNALLGAHARLGEEMITARKVFDKMPERNIISWNAMVVGYVNAGNLAAARAVFNSIPNRNVVSWTVIIVGYCKNGLVDAAREMFDEMPKRNLVSWTVMIAGYTQGKRAKEAIALFNEMQRSGGIEPDSATMTSVISAITQLGNPDLARWIETYLYSKRIERNVRVLTALVDMYAKSGEIEKAFRTFDEISSPDSFAYTALINGLASNGHCIEALKVFNRMREEAITPDPITFIGVLRACGHSGLVEHGLGFWNSMVEDYGIEPDSDHYACIVDMLGRAGRIEEAYEMIQRMPAAGAHVGALGAMLGACRTYGNVEIAESVARELFVLEPENTGNYVLLSSIYAEKGLWSEAVRVRKMMRGRGAEKLPGSSWI